VKRVDDRELVSLLFQAIQAICIPMVRTDLRDKSGISTASLAKIGKDENITATVLIKICNALNCDISDIMEMVDIPEKDEVQTMG
jgi:DNA-binding Xre family transcriptional regulator